MATHTVTSAWSNGSTTVSKAVEYTADSATVLNLSFSGGDTPAADEPFNISIDYSALKVLYIVSTRACTIETNAVDATGGNTLTLAANVPLLWTHDGGIACPLTQDVTIAYVTTSGDVDFTIDIAVLQDATP